MEDLFGFVIWLQMPISVEGYGEKLLSYIHKWANENKYESVALSSGLQRTDAHRFYENKMGYDKVSYVFKASLK